VRGTLPQKFSNEFLWLAAPGPEVASPTPDLAQPTAAPKLLGQNQAKTFAKPSQTRPKPGQVWDQTLPKLGQNLAETMPLAGQPSAGHSWSRPSVGPASPARASPWRALASFGQPLGCA